MSAERRQPTARQSEAAKTYAKLLNEARTRILGIDDALIGATALPTPLAIEFGYLQLRMLCELVALCCLVAHGDIEAVNARKLQKQYAADFIFKHLEALHQNFYPHPVNVTTTSTSLHLDRLETGFLSKLELLTLYHECGGRLHRGSIAKFQSSAPRAHDADLSVLRMWRDKVLLLLKEHHVASRNNTSHLICFLSHQQAGGEALVVTALSPLPE